MTCCSGKYAAVSPVTVHQGLYGSTSCAMGAANGLQKIAEKFVVEEGKGHGVRSTFS